MADIDIIPDYEGGFSITLGDSSRQVSGNVALLNRFQITFFSEGMFFSATGGGFIVDNYGGRATSMLGTPRALSDVQGITVALTAALNNTVDSIKNNTPEGTPDTEVLDRAEIADIFVKDGVINASIDIYPIRLAQSDLPRFFIPIVSR